MDNKTIYDKDIVFSKEVNSIYKSISDKFNIKILLNSYVEVNEFKFAIEEGLGIDNSGCNSCNLEDDHIIFDDEANKYKLAIETSEWSAYDDEFVTQYIEIDFCPFCGKRL